MTLLADIENATEQGRAIGHLYGLLRTKRSAGERAELLRKIREHADAIGSQLRRVAELNPAEAPDEDVRRALGELGEAMEQVMVQEREYRMSCGAAPDSADEAIGGTWP
jgi:hypothetical protein